VRAIVVCGWLLLVSSEGINQQLKDEEKKKNEMPVNQASYLYPREVVF
jgi:hypothetical protein